MKKYREIGRTVKVFEAVMGKADKSLLKMAYYGAYYKIFGDEMRKQALSMSANPRDEVILEAWNYPNVSDGLIRTTRWQRIFCTSWLQG